ncbi:MAG: hypothetical protein MK078_08375 [Crocinitomicaceae bacterium]|nr:hypothetical protein [Crocinitomicaceae bacterium]
MTENVTFPLYRKYKEIDVWFKINSDSSFIEIKKVGTKVLKTEVEAEIFPEKQFIQDMILCFEGRWEKISEQEYETLARHY